MRAKHENYTYLSHSNADSDLVVTNIGYLQDARKMLKLIYKLIALEEERLIGKKNIGWMIVRENSC